MKNFTLDDWAEVADLVLPVERGFLDIDELVAHDENLSRSSTQWVQKIQEAKVEFKNDGAVASYSTCRKEYRGVVKDNRMTQGRAVEILAKLPDGKYILRLKYLRRGAQNKLVIEDKLSPIKLRKDSSGIVILKKTSPPGVLVGIDKPYYERAYPLSAVIYGIYKMREPDIEKLPPMKKGDINCVASLVIDNFKSAIRGGGLTEKRLEQINKWEVCVREGGASIKDIVKLEYIIKRGVVVKDIAGCDLYNSRKYITKGNVIEVLSHNKHAWTTSLSFPKNRVVKFYDGDVWESLKEVIEDKPATIWSVGGGPNQLSVSQFVLEDGSVYRTNELHQSLVQICNEFGYPSIVDQIFGENHAAFVAAKEKNEWRPTQASFLEDIKKSCVEHGHGGLWNSANYDVVELDMKTCYPASFRGLGDAKSYFNRFGHPRHQMTRIKIDGALPENIGTGFARVVEWKFRDGLHPVIVSWIGSHFIENKWTPTQLLVYLKESGILQNIIIGEVIIAF